MVELEIPLQSGKVVCWTVFDNLAVSNQYSAFSPKNPNPFSPQRTRRNAKGTPEVCANRTLMREIHAKLG
jgi:hypothetical protein